MTDEAFSSLALILIAFFQAAGLIVVAFFQYRQTTVIREVRELAVKTEHNTNSMAKRADEVAAAYREVTYDAALAKGKEEERIAGDARRDAEAKGRAEERHAKEGEELDAVVEKAINGEE